jgi:hypothetical protein
VSFSEFWIPITNELKFSDDDEKQRIRAAMDNLQKFTCVRFVWLTNQRDFIVLYPGVGCWSYLGKRGRQQNLSLQKNGCLSQRTIMHELIHALGYGEFQSDDLHSSQFQMLQITCTTTSIAILTSPSTGRTLILDTGMPSTKSTLKRRQTLELHTTISQSCNITTTLSL